MKVKIKKSYRYASDMESLKIANRVADSTKGNPSFPDAGPIQTRLEKVCGEYTGTINKAGRNDRTLAAVKNGKKAEMIGILDELADHVTAVSNGDPAKLLSSGFDISGIKAIDQNLAEVEKFTVELGGPGIAITRVKKVTGAKAYIHKCTPDPMTPDSVWITDTTTDRENTFTNLKSVSRYWFQVFVVGKDKQMKGSTLMSKVIQ
ncbi:hypothetical protein A4D02_13775 [Niastella koreensis]|uniref:Fibronectin type-III domain-containing protein n=2 Tax=Niastella koreensis TaxID=354356 RepID=G8TQ21_NIAKG|nr:hypothetical protein [Niastella koreensis]AEW01022.1 hypothetical protein Niako_4771 [Niastella koreensis GR20-10]OQP42628.1 hypothetical protein A4D02_13775 [Niastella koreensis]